MIKCSSMSISSDLKVDNQIEHTWAANSVYCSYYNGSLNQSKDTVTRARQRQILNRCLLKSFRIFLNTGLPISSEFSPIGENSLEMRRPNFCKIGKSEA